MSSLFALLGSIASPTADVTANASASLVNPGPNSNTFDPAAPQSGEGGALRLASKRTLV